MNLLKIDHLATLAARINYAIEIKPLLFLQRAIAEKQKLLVISVFELQLSVAEHRHFKSIRGKRANRPGTEIAQNFSFVAGPAPDCDHECRGRYGHSAASQS